MVKGGTCSHTTHSHKIFEFLHSSLCPQANTPVQKQVYKSSLGGTVEEQPLAMLCRPLKTNANYTDAGWKTEFQALRRVYRYQIGQLLIQPTSKPQQHQISKNLQCAENDLNAQRRCNM